jgi:hypothetical protein
VVTADLDAAALVGLLADDDRRRVVAALELGAEHLDEIERATGLTTVRAAKALGRLADAGLVVDAGGALHLMSAAFGRAARQALARPASDEHDDAPAAARKVLGVFVQDGRIVQIPTVRSKRLVVLDWLVQDFEVGRRYSEAMVNLIIGKRHPDTAAWRRYLVDEDMLSRESGEYWRSGGSVAT